MNNIKNKPRPHRPDSPKYRSPVDRHVKINFNPAMTSTAARIFLIVGPVNRVLP